MRKLKAREDTDILRFLDWLVYRCVKGGENEEGIGPPRAAKFWIERSDHRSFVMGIRMR